MANTSLFELDTFVSKFRNLWQAGQKACLSVESNNGKATVTLRLDLDAPDGPGQHVHHQRQPKRNCTSQQRRRERRAAVRIAEEAAANNLPEEASETLIAEKAQPDVSENEDRAAKDILSAAEEVSQKDEKVLDEFCTDESFNENTESCLDCEVYLLKYSDTSKVIEAQDVVNYIEDKLKYNFNRYKVKEADRIFKIKYNGEAFEVQIKLKNNNPSRVTNSVRNLEISKGNLNIEVREIHK